MNNCNQLGMPLFGARRLAFNQLNERIYNGNYQLIGIDKCFCGKSDFKMLNRFDRFGLPFGTKICLNCGLITLDKMLGHKDWASFYSELYWPLIKGADASLFQTDQDDFSEFSAFLTPHLSDNVKVVMEVGCGSGVRLNLVNNMIGRESTRLIGADYSNEALKLAKSSGIEVLLGGMDELKAAGQADVLILSHVFEHLPNLKQSLIDISDLTHKNSKIYIEVPGVVDLENKREYGFDYQDYSVLAHIHNFSLATLTNIFKSAGFELIKGNEYARAVFGRNVDSPQVVNNQPHEQIMDALQRANSKSIRHNQSFVRKLRRAFSVAKEEFNL